MTNSLYFSQDNQVLLTFPVNSGIIFLSKIFVFYVVELVKNFIMLVPLFLAYGIVNSFPWFFYPWLIFIFFIISFIPIGIGAVFSIPYMYVLSFIKKMQYVQGILAITGLVTLSVLLFIGLSKIPADLKIATNWSSIYYPRIENISHNIEAYCGPLFYVPALVLGYRGWKYNSNPRSLNIITSKTGLIFLGAVGIIILCLAFAYFLAKPLFFKMATKPFEYIKKTIKHNFRANLTKENIYEKAFRPQLQYPISRKDKEGIVNKLSALLRRVNREEKLFLRRNINTRRILRFLNKYAKHLKFEEVDKTAITDFGFVIQIRNGVPFLVLIKGITGNVASCYDPNYLGKKNHHNNSTLTLFIKEILIDIRTPGIILSNFMLFIITPLAIALLNAIFRAINTNFQGQNFTIMFNVLIIMLIALASNVSMASIYSREGKSSYMLKAAPINYMKSLTCKLLIRAFIVVASLLATSIIYNYYSTIKFLRADLLFLAFTFVYLGHLLWSAELDFMNPQDRLYSEVGASVNNPNETISAVITFIISFIFMGITFFFVRGENPDPNAFLKIMLISFAFFGARVLLFVLKILGYGTSRSERRDN